MKFILPHQPFHHHAAGRRGFGGRSINMIAANIDTGKSATATSSFFRDAAPWDPYDDRATAGRQEGWHTLVLKGAAPICAKNGCAVIGYEMNGKATLKFVSRGD